MIFKREWCRSSDWMRKHGKRIWDEWGWIGVAIKRLTLRLWWVRNGTTYIAGFSVWGITRKMHTLSIGKYGLIHYIIHCSLWPVEKRDHFRFLFQIKIGRIELDLSIYKIAPDVARPDLWA